MELSRNQVVVAGGLRFTLAPAEALCAALHGLRQATSLDDFWFGLTPLAPDFAKRVLVPCLHRVLEPELDGVPAHLATDTLHMRLQRPEALGHAITPVSA